MYYFDLRWCGIGTRVSIRDGTATRTPICYRIAGYAMIDNTRYPRYPRTDSDDLEPRHMTLYC